MRNLTLIIINDDAEEYLYRLFESLKIQVGIDDCEIVFVDNCSKDKSVQMAEKYGVHKIYKFEDKIYSRALLYNKGYEISRTQFLVFAHSDIFFDRDFFKTLYERIESHQISDFINFSQHYADSNYFGNNEIGIDVTNHQIFYKQLFQYLPHGMPLYLECSEACFMVNRQWIDDFSFNSSYSDSFFEFDLLSNIINNSGTYSTLKQCIFTHYFIELHEKLKTLQNDKKLFIRNHGYVFKLFYKDYQMISLNNRIEELSRWGISLDEEIEKRDQIIVSQNVRIEKLSAWGIRQDEEIAKKDRIIVSQNARREKLSASTKQLEEVVTNKNGIIDELSLREDILEKDNSKLKQLLESIKTASEQVLAEQEGRIQPLFEKEMVLDNVYNSRGWRMLLKLYWLEGIVLPLQSKRRKALKTIYFLWKNLKLIIKHINKDNLKKFFTYAKKESPGQVLKHIKSYLNRYKPNEKIELQIFETKETYEKLSFMYSSNPIVSIIIPVYNQWNYTYSCLCSIMENTGSIEYEIIIADDVSSDETVNIKSYIENITVVRNTKNLGFLLNCNNAAKQARGKYILLLNNDTNVQKDWLRYLIDLIEKDCKIGMVGSKLVFADGRLQEAGGIIWRDASGWNYGRLDDPEKPEYNYVKEVDYITGASIMIRADLWENIGGFDARYAPAYFEDSDLAFEVRKHGYKVMYQPKSIVVHFEGISHGTDTESGIKSYQIKNKEKFIKKWKENLEADKFGNGQNVFLARDRSRRKKTILVIDHYVPHYDKDAGSRTTFQYLKLFTEMGLNVKFLGDNFYRHEPYTSDLQQLGIEVLYGVWYRDNWGKWVKENADEIDYVYLNRPHISIKYIDFIKHNTKAKIIYYGHDLHYLRELREYAISKDKDILKSAENWKKIEFELINKADVVYYPSQIEIDEIKKHFTNINAKAIPAYIFDNTEQKSQYIPETRKDIMFVGGFTHKPNIDAVLWFVKEIFPGVLNVIPDMELYIIGSNPTDEIKELASKSVIVTGFVSDEQLDKYYENCKLTVVPLRYGAGVKGKIVEAMYKQLPVITTPTGAEGLIDVDNCIKICNMDETFAKKLINLYNDEYKLKQLSNKALAYVNTIFSDNRVLEIIREDIQP